MQNCTQMNTILGIIIYKIQFTFDCLLLFFYEYRAIVTLSMCSTHFTRWLSTEPNYSVHSGKNADLNAFLLKQDAKQVSSVAGISVSIPIASSPSASHFFIILSTLPMTFKMLREYQGKALIAFSNSARSSFLFLFVSRYFPAQRTIWGRLNFKNTVHVRNAN